MGRHYKTGRQLVKSWLVGLPDKSRTITHFSGYRVYQDLAAGKRFVLVASLSGWAKRQAQYSLRDGQLFSGAVLNVNGDPD